MSCSIESPCAIVFIELQLNPLRRMSHLSLSAGSSRRTSRATRTSAPSSRHQAQKAPASRVRQWQYDKAAAASSLLLGRCPLQASVWQFCSGATCPADIGIGECGGRARRLPPVSASGSPVALPLSPPCWAKAALSALGTVEKNQTKNISLIGYCRLCYDSQLSLEGKSGGLARAHAEVSIV